MIGNAKLILSVMDSEVPKLCASEWVNLVTFYSGFYVAEFKYCDLALPLGTRMNFSWVKLYNEIQIILTYRSFLSISDSSAQLNMRGVFLHVLGDALGSVIVIISALVIKFVNAEWKYKVDPALR